MQHIIFDVDYENNDEECDETENEESDQGKFFPLNRNTQKFNFIQH